jgi:sulfite exporter TauE/SafE/copper chaperone CopZ
MSRSHARTSTSAQRRSARGTPRVAQTARASVATSRPIVPVAASSAPIEGGVRERDIIFGIEVDNLLARMAEDRREGRSDMRSAGAALAGALTTIVHVAGMTCRSCENRIARHVSKIPNVEQVRASAVHGRVEITSTAPIPTVAVAKAIRAAGYELGRTSWLTPDPDVWLTAIFGIVLVGGLAVLASVTGLADLASGVGDLTEGGILIALLLGLAAGVSTCAALVGGLVLALSAAFETRRTASGAGDVPIVARMRPALVFIAGRIAGYGVLGAALGALGASVTMPPQLTAALMIGVALVMTVLGTRLTGLSPRIATWSPTLPMGLGRRLGLADGAIGSYSDARAAGLGAASFFLPCGFTQAVQIYALSTGSPLLAGATLAVFALGTAPGLLALAGLPVVVPRTWRPTLMRLVGVVVVGFAIVNGTAGLRLSGITLPFGVPSVAAAAPPTGTITDGIQTLTTYQNVDGYSPTNVSIYAGIPTRWTIQSTSTSSCAASLVVPGLGMTVRRLHKGANTIDLPALGAGRIGYSCAMGMYGGSITIVERPAPSTGASGTGG